MRQRVIVQGVLGGAVQNGYQFLQRVCIHTQLSPAIGELWAEGHEPEDARAIRVTEDFEHGAQALGAIDHHKLAAHQFNVGGHLTPPSSGCRAATAASAGWAGYDAPPPGSLRSAQSPAA